jgi:hypothetical protein
MTGSDTVNCQFIFVDESFLEHSVMTQFPGLYRPDLPIPARDPID